MFTETPPANRRQRGKPAFRKSSGGLPPAPPPDQPATPLTGAPSFSYGSSTTALPRAPTLGETNLGIFAAMKRAGLEGIERDQATSRARGFRPVLEAEEESKGAIEGQISEGKLIGNFGNEEDEKKKLGGRSKLSAKGRQRQPANGSPVRRSTRGKSVLSQATVDTRLTRSQSPFEAPEISDGITVKVSPSSKTDLTHVLLRESPRKSTRRTLTPTTRFSIEVPKNSSIESPSLDEDTTILDYSKDYTYEERIYNELLKRGDVAEPVDEEEEIEIPTAKESQYSDDDVEEESEEEDELNTSIYPVIPDEDPDTFGPPAGDEYDDEEEEILILEPLPSLPRKVIKTIRSAAMMGFFFISTILSAILHGIVIFVDKIKYFLMRGIEIFIFVPVYWMVDAFKLFFGPIANVLGRGMKSSLTKLMFVGIVGGFMVLTFAPILLSVLAESGITQSILRYRLPHWIGPPTYTPPLMAPESSQEIVDRLLELEKNLIANTAYSSDILEQNKALQRGHHEEKVRRENLDASVHFLKKELEKVEALTKLTGGTAAAVKQMEKENGDAFRSIQSALNRLERDLATETSLSKSHTTVEKSHKKEIKGLQTQLEALQKQVARVESDLKTVSSFDYVSQIALSTLEQYLPPQLAVRINPKSKKMDINPEFWKALRNVFPDKKEMETKIGNELIPIGKDSKQTSASASWKEFIKSNEEAIKSFIKVQTDDKWNKAGEDGVIVSKDYFLEILAQKLSGMRAEVEARNQEIWKSVERAAKDVETKSLKNTEAVVAAALKKANFGNGAGKGVEDLSSEALNTIVETALHRYSTDTLAKPDYALYSSGARVNPMLTSLTYLHQPNGIVKRVLGMATGAGSTWGHQPAMALLQDTNVGMCWAFKGKKGGLGIRLSEKILVTDVSVEHVHRDVAKDLSSAPSNWTLYALVPDLEARDQIANVTASLYSAPVVEEEANLPLGYVKMVQGRYDLASTKMKSIQTIPVPAAVRRLNIPVRDVVFSVGGNWGNKAYTCLYRVRVHGVGIGEGDDTEKGFGDDEVL